METSIKCNHPNFSNWPGQTSTRTTALMSKSGQRKMTNNRDLNFAAAVVQQLAVPTFVLDAMGSVIVWNTACEVLTGMSADKVIGTRDHWRAFYGAKRPCLADLLFEGHLEEIDQYYPIHRRSLDLALGVHAESWCVMPLRGNQLYLEIDAGPIYDEAGHLVAVVETLRDMTCRESAEARIAHLAHHDALTGLFNRYSLESRLEQSLLAARRENKQMAVIFIDLDRFKIINDTLGHHVGDLLLVEVANRLSACVRESDIVARLGGDEFVVALTSLANDMDAAHVVKKIIAVLDIPCEIEGKQLHTTLSVGISFFPDNGEDVDALMKNADTAMYHAKEMGRNNFQFFSPAMMAAATERLEIERDLRIALKNNEFELHYQPQVCANKGLIRGVEALIRWRHPDRGLIPPLKFIPIAEESGVIESIGSWVLEEACRQMAEWRKAGFDLKHVAVNLSAHQLRSSDLVRQVQSAIARFGLTPGQLELEITESVAMEDPERAIGQLHMLRDSGVVLAIDDFGTGYSSLAYLKMLPIHTLKLDRAFVRDIETNENDAAISSATLALAKNLGLRVVAEGVETEGQRDFLTSHACNLLQGYLFGKPEPADVLTAHWQTSAAMPRVV